MSFILDSSMALSWCFKNEETPETVRVFELAKRSTLLVPELWYLEMSNILGLALRKGRMDDAGLQLALGTFHALEIQLDRPQVSARFQTLLPLMQRHNLTAYDATYLESAVRLHLPLATLDARLSAAAAAADAGVSLIAGVA